MFRVKFALAFVWITLMVVVIVQNRDPVDVDVLFLTLTSPQAAFLSIATLCGTAILMLVALRNKVRNSGDPQRVDQGKRDAPVKRESPQM